MAESIPSSSSRRFGGGTLLGWLMGVLCFGVLVFFIAQVILQFAMPTTVHRLQLVKDVPLPSIVVPPGPPPIYTVRADRFDFQALDPQSGLLFIAHPGPSAAKSELAQEQLPQGTVLRETVVVFDTKQNEYVGSLQIPNVHGIAVAPDIHKVYFADFDDSKIYVINEQTCKATPQPDQNACTIIKQINASQNPDSLDYDSDHHKVFVSEPGGATLPKGIEDVIDTQTDNLVKKINLGTGVGHVRYDSVSHRIFVVAGTDTQGELVSINPITESIASRFGLPGECTGAHGLIIDSPQQVAFVVCTGIEKVAMVDIQRMKSTGTLQQVGVKPDILALDHGLHILYVGSVTSVSVFDESKASSGTLTRLGRPGDYIISTGSTHTIAVNDATHELYVPLTDLGGQPVLRIEQYSPNATD